MGFIDDEASVQSSRPREGIEIIASGQTWRIATGTRDLTINGEKYTAAPAQRGELGVALLGDDAAPELVLYPRHKFVERYMVGGVPPRSVLVNVWRKQLNSGDVESVWRGRIVSATWRRQVPVFKMASRRLLLADRRLPSFSVSKRCPHTLYAAGTCKVARASFKVTTTISLVNGRTISVASMGAHPDGWAKFGELVHASTGEAMTIAEQVGTQLTVPAPIGSLRDGDSVEVYAGCDHTIATCHTKFSNRVHFGGCPQLNEQTIPTPPGFGIYTSA